MNLTLIPAAIRPTGAQMFEARATLAARGAYSDTYAAAYLFAIAQKVASGGKLKTADVAMALASLEVVR